MTRSSSLGVSSSQRFSVFDFTEDDERVEEASEKRVGKFIKRRKRDFSSPVDKYKFLQLFAGCASPQEKESSNEPIVVDDGLVDVDLERGIETPGKVLSNEPIDLDSNGVGKSQKTTVSPPMWVVQENVDVEEISCLDALALSSSANYESRPVDMILDDDDEGTKISFSSVSDSTIGEKVLSKDLEPKCCSFGHKIDTLNNSVVVFPDFILYEDVYCTESCITFSSSCMRVEGSTVNGVKGSLKAEWTIGDIISIESEWWGRVETALLNLSFKPNVSKGCQTAAGKTSGIDKLKFSVYDPCWFKGQEAIKSLDYKYRAIWNNMIDSEQEKDGSAFSGPSSMTFPRPYVSVLDETFEEVVYPEGDPDAVLISKRDVELLQPETFINDTIIDFYIQYLKNKIQPEEQHRFHFFNSFFFRKLADLDKGPCSACEGRAAFQRVRKWTKKVKLFEKDYIFIPVNYSFHWSLIVICYPGDVACFVDGESERAIRVPCILHMDSIRGSHRGLKNLIQSYLCEEWKERHNDTPDDVSSKFSHLRFVPLELPQQENSFDCGLFLLHYAELFLEEAPSNFSPFTITESSNFLNRNWFPPMEASLKRLHIQKLICQILEESLSSNSPIRKGWQQVKEPRLGTRKLFEPETSTRKFSCGNYSHMGASRLNFVSPIKEIEEASEKTSDSSSDAEDCCDIVELATDSSNSYSVSLRTYPALRKSSWKHTEKLYDNVSSSEISNSSGSQKSSEIGVDGEATSHPEFEGIGYVKETQCQESSSTSTGDFADCIVEDSQEENGVDPAPSDGEFESMEDNVKKNSALAEHEDLLVIEPDESAVKTSGMMSQESGR